MAIGINSSLSESFTVQIIFFTESANAMMQSDLGLTFVQLVVIFLIRTVIAIPIVAGFAHLLF